MAKPSVFPQGRLAVVPQLAPPPCYGQDVTSAIAATLAPFHGRFLRSAHGLDRRDEGLSWSVVADSVIINQVLPERIGSG